MKLASNRRTRMSALRYCLAAAVFVMATASVVSVSARHQIELESTYLGDGWFKYRLKTVNDPFFLFFDLGSLGVVFTNRVEYGPFPEDWTSFEIVSPYGDGGWGTTNCNSLACQIRPYERVFTVRSSERHFNTRFRGLVTMSFSTVGGYHGHATSGNVVGYVTMSQLAPCSAEEADGSATNLLAKVEITSLPDVEITRLERDGDRITGVTFYYDENSTVRLEGTRNFRDWTSIAYIYGSRGYSTWTTNVPLNSFDNYFRLALIAEGHETNLPPLNPDSSGSFAAAEPRTSTGADNGGIRVLNCRPVAGGVEATIVAEPNQACEVSLLNGAGRTLQSQRITARKNTETVRFQISNPPNPVLVRAVLVK